MDLSTLESKCRHVVRTAATTGKLELSSEDKEWINKKAYIVEMGRPLQDTTTPASKAAAAPGASGEGAIETKVPATGKGTVEMKPPESAQVPKATAPAASGEGARPGKRPASADVSPTSGVVKRRRTGPAIIDDDDEECTPLDENAKRRPAVTDGDDVDSVQGGDVDEVDPDDLFLGFSRTEWHSAGVGDRHLDRANFLLEHPRYGEGFKVLMDSYVAVISGHTHQFVKPELSDLAKRLKDIPLPDETSTNGVTSIKEWTKHEHFFNDAVLNPSFLKVLAERKCVGSHCNYEEYVTEAIQEENDPKTPSKRIEEMQLSREVCATRHGPSASVIASCCHHGTDTGIDIGKFPFCYIGPSDPLLWLTLFHTFCSGGCIVPDAMKVLGACEFERTTLNPLCTREKHLLPKGDAMFAFFSLAAESLPHYSKRLCTIHQQLRDKDLHRQHRDRDDNAALSNITPIPKLDAFFYEWIPDSKKLREVLAKMLCQSRSACMGLAMQFADQLLHDTSEDRPR